MVGVKESAKCGFEKTVDARKTEKQLKENLIFEVCGIPEQE